MPYLLCAITSVLLASPGFTFPYLFDDYDFLGRAQLLRINFLAPEPGLLFYRPLSREIYFWILELISPGSALGGHIVNALVLAATVVLGGTLASKLAGRRAGVIAGLLIATFAHWPVLVSWVCGAQDLFAIALTLAALHFQLRGRGAAALIAFAGAVLSKEAAIMAAPALVSAVWLQSRSRQKVVSAAIRIGLLVSAWAVIHPGVHVLLTSGGANPPGGYVGFDNPRRWTSLGRSMPALLNLPLTGYTTSWPAELNSVLLLTLVPVSIVLWILRGQVIGGVRSTASSPPPSGREIAGFGVLLALPPLLLTGVMVQYWVPYYLCFPAVGLSIALSRWIAGMPYARAAALLALYAVLGVWSRGIELVPGMATERDLAAPATALPQLEKNFKRVAPSLPHSSLVYVSTMATGTKSVYIHMHRLQALRVWYSDATIRTLRPELRVGAANPEFLFWIDPSLNVFQVDLRRLSVRSSGGAVDPRDYRSALTSYAVGLASLGDTQRAVEILLGLSDPATWNHVIDRRIAATLLLSWGEEAAAVDVVRGTPKLPYKFAIETIGVLLTVPSRSTHYETYALKAFGVPPSDVGARRVLMRGLLGLGHYEVAGRLAHQVLLLNPGDQEATRALEKVSSVEESPNRITTPAHRGL